jgi:hypothetical protein
VEVLIRGNRWVMGIVIGMMELVHKVCFFGMSADVPDLIPFHVAIRVELRSSLSNEFRREDGNFRGGAHEKAEDVIFVTTQLVREEDATLIQLMSSSAVLYSSHLYFFPMHYTPFPMYNSFPVLILEPVLRKHMAFDDF